MSNKTKNEYDQIKGMLNTLRGLNESVVNNKKSLLEQVNVPDDKSSNPEEKEYDNIEVVNDVEVKLISPDTEDTQLRDDEKDAISQVIDSFRLEVSQTADLDPGFTVTEKQIRLDGSNSDFDMNFVVVAGEQSGLYVTSDMSLVDDNVLEFMTKMAKYHKTFVSAMEPLIRSRKTT